MRFAFTDEQDALRESVRGAVQRTIPLAHARAAIEAGDRSILRRLSAQQGWGGVGTPEALGGQGGGVVETAVLVDELARAAVPGSTVLTGAIARALLVSAGGCPGADALVARIAGDDVVAAVALRADTGGIGEVTVVDGYADGVVPHVLGAPEAGVLLLASADGLHLVQLEGPGVRLTPHNLLDLGRTIADVELTGAPADRLADAADPRRACALAAVLVAADALGAARGLLEMTVDHVLRREQFGVPIGSFQAVKHAAADMLVGVETAHSAVYYAAWAVDAGDSAASRAVAVAKSFATDAAARVADTALALHGAIGFTWEHDLHLLLRRARTACVLYGRSSAHEADLADQLELDPTRPFDGRILCELR